VLQTLTDRIKFYESIFGAGHISTNGKNFDVRCPICSPTDPTKKKLSIRTTDDANHCWTCGWKSRTLLPLLRKHGTQDQFETYRKSLGLKPSTAHVVEVQKKLELPKDFRLLTQANESDPDVKAAWRYVYSRGMSDKEAWYYKLGVSEEARWKRRIIVPSFDDRGELNYFVARSIDKDRKPKYDNPDVDKNPIVFNELNLNWSKQVVLVEGVFDMFKCPENTIPLLGSDLDERHEVFNKILLHNCPVALALDGDMWDKKTPKLVKKLEEYNVDVVVVDVRPWSDPGSMSKSEFNEALKQAKKLTWNDTFLGRLNRASTTSFRL
jgi:hypothetical protein